MKKIDELLDSITMYRLVVYVLLGFVGLGLVFSFLGQLSFSPTAIIVSLGLLLGSAYVTDRGLARLFNVPSNMETWLITSLILFLILQPANSVSSGLALLLAGGVSSASKFLLAWNGRHIFNPAAFAAALLSLTALWPATWWIGSGSFWPFTLIFGLAIVRKIRRTPLFITFVSSSIALQLALFLIHQQPVTAGMKGALISSPLIFLSTIMLTEPATMPPRRNQQILFALISAVLYVTAWKVGPLYIYPEVALLLANLYAFAVAPKFRVRLTLKQIQKISDQVYNYVFTPDRRFNFLPGQYMEWTLAGVPYDSRGNRRTFTIASSPTEEEVHVGLKYYQPSSTYKATFAQLKIGDTLFASQLAGNFTLDQASTEKLAFIAGGIGITPFRSMVRELLDTNTRRDIVLIYLVSNPDELAYKEVFLEAKRIGVRLVPLVTKEGFENVPGIVNARFSQNLLKSFIPDATERTFLVSGPHYMVESTKTYLSELGVPMSQVKTDHFSGY